MKNFSNLSLEQIKQTLSQLNSTELKNLDRFELIEIQKQEIIPPLLKEKTYFRYRQIQVVDQPIEKAFEFFSEAKNLEEITPKLLNFKIVSQSTKEIQQDTEFIYRLKVHGVPMQWKTKITEWDPPYQFVDYQEKGPYAAWYHTHLFISYQDKTILLDEVKFVLPFGFLGKIFSSWLVKKDVKNIFKHRYEYIEKLV